MTDYKREKEAGDHFGLHDAHDFDYEKEELRLVWQYGFADTAADEMVDREVILTGVSAEDSYGMDGKQSPNGDKRSCSAEISVPVRSHN